MREMADVRNLEKTGFSRVQAEAVVSLFLKKLAALEKRIDAKLAKKLDRKDFDHAIEKLRGEIIIKVGAMIFTATIAIIGTMGAIKAFW